ncbi:MAG: Mpo1-like protein [Undibacterium umbellatum]|uniref:Mpo1-like protein n=1 Tax=Undibacterium umbellatum TaxID=2762300 RepID=UPI003BB5CD26
MAEKFTNFSAFYAFYLTEHSNKTCRQLHFLGSTLVIICLAGFIATGAIMYLLAAPICGYGFAWIGHFVFEKNRPASFKQPLFSFMGDWVMYWQLLSGKIRFAQQDEARKA